RALNIFDALPPHAVAVSYPRPIRTHHNAIPSTSAKPPGKSGKTGGFAVAPQTGHVVGAVGLITPERSSLGPTPRSYTRASRLGTNWVKADVSAFTAKPPGRAG